MNVVLTDASFKTPNKAIISMLAGNISKRESIKANSSTHAELLSVEFALKYLKKEGIKNATIINDNKPIVDHLNNKAKINNTFKNTADNTKKLMKETNSKVEWCSRKKTKMADILCSLPTKGEKVNNFKTLSLPRLDRLSPNLISTSLKLMEEAGELAQVIGKFQGLSGEKNIKKEKAVIDLIARELLDVAQTAVTMMFVLEEEYGVSIDIALKQHINKLKQKGYMY